MRSKASASPTSCVAHSSVASRQRARAVGEQAVALAAVQAAQRLVEHGQPHAVAIQRAGQAHALALAAGQQPAVGAERLVADARGDAVELGRPHERGDALRVGERGDVGVQVAVPDAHLRLDPGDVRPQRVRAAAGQRPAVDRHPPVGGVGEAERQRQQRRLARARRADERDVLARRDPQRRRR